jgi:hypothetical protein
MDFEKLINTYLVHLYFYFVIEFILKVSYYDFSKIKFSYQITIVIFLKF